ncbi:uncharacterized protein BO87DRAFT_299323 [Aspergillus neoniger CBS 115656]|uniref:Uncharacterized protein n=1 Tax=Aspergillus neoniger (strain CBS 115656) TaxID=1448310 RepID=A0A318YVT1_ASPNB|nr:hypothetical protein BO87DRAFT_299323 [Aspergillus neoniger CBS 115656]PYH38354.1 hypothetical protein BO87DRAFT_299323 [Aspergillus neoniger CBS 115656]
MAQCTRPFRDMYNMVLKTPLLLSFVGSDNVISGFVPKDDKDSERWHPTVRDGSAQRDHGKHRVGQSLRPSFRIRGAKHPPLVTLFLHLDDNNHILWFRLTRILLLQIGYQQYALHSRDYSILKLWNLQKTQIVAAPSTSLLIANPPAVPIVSSARMTCLTNEILGSTLNPDWDDDSQQIAYAVSLHPCLPHANPGRWVPSIMDSISPDYNLTDSCGFELHYHAVSGYGSGTPALDRTFLYLPANDNARRPINSRNSGERATEIVSCHVF